MIVGEVYFTADFSIEMVELICQNSSSERNVIYW